MAKKMTIEDLAMMVKHGFDETAKEAAVDKRIEGVESEMRKGFSRIENLFA